MFLKKFITVPAQICFFVVVSAIVCFFLIRPIFTFSPIFQEPAIYAATDGQPVAAKEVKVGLSVDDFLAFNFKKNQFSMKAVLWFEYNPQEIDLKKIDDFYLERGRILQKHGPVITQLPHNRVRALYYITCEYGAVLDFSMFPFDDHRVFLEIVYPSLDPHEVVVVSSSSAYVLGDHLHISGWLIKTHKTKSGVKRTKMPDNTFIEEAKSYFSIGVTKRDFRLIMLILLPLLLIFYFGMFSLSLIGDKAISLALTSVSGLIAYRYVINSLEPDVSYLLISDYFFILLLLESFIIFSVNLFCASDYTKIAADTLDAVKGGVLVLLYVILIAVWYYLTNVMYAFAFTS